MGNMLNRGAAMVAAKLKASAGTPVVYRSGPLSIAVTAIVGDTSNQVDNMDGVTVRTHTRDYLVDAVDLVDLAGPDPVIIEPRRGDTITDHESNPAQVYEVLPMAGEPCWRWSDRAQKRRRIHTKWVETVTE
jgi:hypothetical protein